MARKRNQAKRGKNKGSRMKNKGGLINNVGHLININFGHNGLIKWTNNSIIYVGIILFLLLTLASYYKPQSMSLQSTSSTSTPSYFDQFNLFSSSTDNNHNNGQYYSTSSDSNDHHHGNHNYNSPNHQQQRGHHTSNTHSPSHSNAHSNHNINGGGHHQFCRIQSSPTPTPNFQRQLEQENKGYIEFQGCRIVPSTEHTHTSFVVPVISVLVPSNFAFIMYCFLSLCKISKGMTNEERDIGELLSELQKHGLSDTPTIFPKETPKQKKLSLEKVPRKIYLTNNVFIHIITFSLFHNSPYFFCNFAITN